MFTDLVHNDASRRRLDKAFGRAVWAARRRRGLTRKQVAARVGVTAFYVRTIEQGYQAPSLAVIVALGLACDADPVDLIRATLRRSQDRPT
jgi:transcriptional regulator with XRE-family HTH domain